MKTWVVISLGAAGCVPTLDGDVARVSAPRVLAVQLSPAQAAPGERVTASVLLAGPVGAPSPTPRWWRCDLRRTLAEPGAISARCLGDPDAGGLVALGEGATVSLTVPDDACGRFGPNPPPPERSDEPAGRPTDPDPTGGYFAPFRVSIGDGVDAIGEVRLRCPLPAAPPAEVIAFNRRDRGNANPVIASLRASVDGREREVDGSLDVPAGALVRWTLAWPACGEGAACGDGVCDPEDDPRMCPQDCAPMRACEGAERYPFYDGAARATVVRREAMRVSFYGTAGAFARPRAAVSGEDRSTQVSNAWTAPRAAGPVSLWFVLRDDRGGVAWRVARVNVTE